VSVLSTNPEHETHIAMADDSQEQLTLLRVNIFQDFGIDTAFIVSIEAV
jgi:hypothetical protein